MAGSRRTSLVLVEFHRNSVTLSLGYGLEFTAARKPKELAIDFTVDPKWLFTWEAKILMGFLWLLCAFQYVR